MEFAVSDLRVEFGARVLFDALSFVVERRERIAFAGQNGAGKSTLMKCIVGLHQPDRGRVLLPKHTRIGYLPQECVCTSGSPLLATVLGCSAGEPSLRPKAETILRGLGFCNSDFEKDCGVFSGGRQMRIALAKVLFRAPEVLLLDEPTNHLDPQSRRWLEQYLRSYSGAICIISHDTALLDALVTRTIALCNGRAEEYAGNFSFYLRQSRARREALQRAAETRRREAEKTQAFINRFRYKATKASQVQSRIKQLAKAARIEPEAPAAVMHFRFPPPPPGSATVAELQKVGKAYGDTRLLSDFDLRIEKGDRIAVVGANGAGKSTFTRLISATEAPDTGKVLFGPRTKTAFFSQTHADILDPEQTLLECAEQAAPRETAPSVRNILGCFLFCGDAVFKKIGVLSGGEKARLALVCMLLRPANFLIMDEPTNHLDFRSRDILRQALAEYPGSFCIVSHDRSFLDPIVTKVLEFRPGHNPRLFYGNVSQYLEKMRADAEAAPSPAPAAATAPLPSPAQKNKRAARRTRAHERERLARLVLPLRKELTEIEATIDSREHRKAEITAALSSPEFVTDAEALRRLTEEYAEVDRAAAALYSRWEELSLRLETMQNSPSGGETSPESTERMT